MNGIEWVGRKFNIAQTAVGTILAAVGTALPESVVTFVAVVFGQGDSEKDIGVGAALAGPLVLSTLAYAIVGWLLLSTKKNTTHFDFNKRHLQHDQGWFLIIFVAKLILGIMVFAFKPWLGLLFLIAYGMYFFKEVHSIEVSDQPVLEPLKLRPHDNSPAKIWIVLQTSLALGGIFLASHFFVAQLTTLGPQMGISNQVIALLLSPIATELPEIMNAIIWVRQGKVHLALGNISGSMMIQATVPSALGIFFTPWVLSPSLLLAGTITFIAIFYLYILLRHDAITPKRLTYLTGLYGLFLILILLSMQSE